MTTRHGVRPRRHAPVHRYAGDIVLAAQSKGTAIVRITMTVLALISGTYAVSVSIAQGSHLNAWQAIQARQRPGQPDFLLKTLSLNIPHGEAQLTQLEQHLTHGDIHAIATIARLPRHNSERIILPVCIRKSSLPDVPTRRTSCPCALNACGPNTIETCTPPTADSGCR